MDPRPYNYQFRRPRMNNPTYQSFNAYESLYHMGKVQAQYGHLPTRNQYLQHNQIYSNGPSISNSNVRDSSSRQPSSPKEYSSIKRYEDIGIGTDILSNRSHRAGSNYSQKIKSSVSSNNNNPAVSHRSSVLSNYGSNSLEKNPQNAIKREDTNVLTVKNDCSEIYKRQQKPFDIINLYSRGSDPLRKYPKLTLQHLMYQRGMVKAD